MTMNLVFDSVAPRGPAHDAARLAAPRTAIARAMRGAEPHVGEGRTPYLGGAGYGRLDDLLFGLATGVLAIAVVLPLPDAALRPAQRALAVRTPASVVQPGVPDAHLGFGPVRRTGEAWRGRGA